MADDLIVFHSSPGKRWLLRRRARAGHEFRSPCSRPRSTEVVTARPSRYNLLPMPARSISTATIPFGLVSIPTKLYTTNEAAGDIHFNMLHDADGARLKQQYICTQCNEIVDRDHTAKGYEHAK